MQRVTEAAWPQLQARHYAGYGTACSKIRSDDREMRGARRSERIVERTDQYVRALFNDLLVVEYGALRKRLVPRWRKRYFDDLTSRMRAKIQVEFWRALNEQLGAVGSSGETERHPHLRRDAAVWEKIDSHIALLNTSIGDSIELMRAALREDAIRSIRASVPKLLIGSLIPLMVFLIGLVLLKVLTSR